MERQSDEPVYKGGLKAGDCEGKENMERLTRRTENGTAVYSTASGDPVKWENNRHKVLQKLAEYEDLEERGKTGGGGSNTGMPCKRFFAVIDSYHEALSTIVAIFPTYRAAEEYMAGRVREDRQKGNCYNYYISSVTVKWDME